MPWWEIMFWSLYALLWVGVATQLVAKQWHQHRLAADLARDSAAESAGRVKN